MSSIEERIAAAREKLADLAEQQDVLIGKLLLLRSRRASLRRSIAALERGTTPPRPRGPPRDRVDDVDVQELAGDDDVVDVQDDDRAAGPRAGRGGLEAAKAKLRAQGHDPDRKPRRRSS